MSTTLKKPVPATKLDTNLGAPPQTRRRNHLAQWVMVGVFAFLGSGLFMPVVTRATTPYPDAGIDQTESLGQFAIRLNNVYGKKWLGINTCPGNMIDPNDPCVVYSPTLQDLNTLVGRSKQHQDGDNTDEVDGALIPCRDGTVSIPGCPSSNFLPDTVKDSDFGSTPSDLALLGLFKEGLAGTEEVHTQILSLNLTVHPKCNEPQSATAVRAGFAGIMPEPLEITPRSIGEVESNNPDPSFNMFDPNAESFFNVFVRVDLDPDANNVADTTLYNIDPLVILQDDLTRFPPTVVYIHGGSVWSPLVYENGAKVGWLTLAGHGIGFSCLNPELNKAAFLNAFAVAQRRLNAALAAAGKTPKLEPYWKYALNVPNPDAKDLGVLYITNSSEKTISPIYASMYVKGTPLFENKVLLDSLGPLDTQRFTSADLKKIAGESWSGRGLMKLGCSVSDSGCTPGVLKMMMTGRNKDGGPLVGLTPEAQEIRDGKNGIFTLLGIPPAGGDDIANIRINNISAGQITVDVKMYDGGTPTGTLIGTEQISIEPNSFVRLTVQDLPGNGSWNDEDAWLQIVTPAPAGVTRVQYLMRDKDTDIISNLSVGGGQ